MGLAKNKKKIHVGEFKTTDKIKKTKIKIIKDKNIFLSRYYILLILMLN
jgi:hypothetical protein